MKKIAILFLFVCSVLPSLAQQNEIIIEEGGTIQSLRRYRAGDNWSIGAYIGSNVSLGENIRPKDYVKVMSPSFGLSVGKYLTPSFGFRIQGKYNNLKGRANQETIDTGQIDDGLYNFKSLSLFGDVMFNLTNILSRYNEERNFSFVPFIGLGFLRAFDFDKEAGTWKDLPYGPYLVDTDGGNYLGLRVGVQFLYKLTSSLDLAADLSMNATHDDFNGHAYQDLYDGYFMGMLGLVYHFKDQYGDRRFKYTYETAQGDASAINAKINELRRTVTTQPVVAAAKPDTIYQREEIVNLTVSFGLDQSVITDLQKKNVQALVEYLNRYPDVNVVIVGYADAQTANPAYNLRLSERRARAVYDMLVKEFRVDPGRLRVDFKGDREQPYAAKNEWNRVVRFVTETPKDRHP